MKQISLTSLGQHNSESNGHIAISGHVYDVSDFLDAHPGGKRVLLPLLGKDATAEFNRYHSPTLLTKYKSLVVGTLEGHEVEASSDSTDAFGNLIAFAEPAWYHGQPSPYYNDTHRRLRAWMRGLVEQHIIPHVNDWEAAGEVPSSLYKTFGKEGVLSCMVGVSPWPNWVPHQPPCGIKPEEWTAFHEVVLGDELARIASCGIGAVLSLGPQIALPAVVNYASEGIKERVVGPVLRGEKTICLCITEPSAGSDVANIQTSATISKDGSHYVVNGEKKWITNGAWADFFIVAVRTGKEGMNGISLLLLERGMEGLRTRKIACQGNIGSGTAFVIMDNVKVPASNIIGTVNKGFKCIMANFNHERFGIIIGAIRSARICYEDAVIHAHRRKTFGKPLFDHGVIRNKLANMAHKIEAAQAWMESIVYQQTQMSHEEATLKLGGAIALLKAQATQTVEFCAREASQIMGGISYTKGGVGGRVERIYRDVRGYAIPGGSEEIMLIWEFVSPSRFHKCCME
ncbi:acyl-CoA dehydrogenase NM domain-like protein [Rhizoclosmatium globosum]|uniref:Acyl-CoA dehydrogenase NM domain-like protein n=1 Tax=Rhizoclosmatium globosum TaxID=329046 RepID=A0A1Y2CVE0_9FUNG|nr:acyl-CoA dehydrogenase NM domain-like protein [Rhizoclosmatium globosum]|eukprot:ORY51020.1 acyl-CoA dehydrogenase NM domain-like protein [Rhizoclosmatium globosum]